MNVGELKFLLENYPEDMRVLVDGYEDGYDDIVPERMVTQEVVLRPGGERSSIISGQHDDVRRACDGHLLNPAVMDKIQTVLILRRRQ